MSHQSKTFSGQPKGTLIIIGGHEELEGERVILREVASQVRGDRLVLATVGAREPEGYLERYQAAFADLGVTDITELHVENRLEAEHEEKVSHLDKVRAVFFSGGDQLRIASQIGDTPIYSRLHEIYHTGGLVAGTSAGASVMCETMLVKGSSATSFRIGDLRMAPGLGLMRGVIIDQHFAERGRIGRLIGAVALNPRILGIGIDEDTAIVVQGTGFRVIGNGAVYLVDAGQVSSSNIAEARPDALLSIHDLKIHVLSAGDRFDLEARRPDMAQAKAA